MYDVLFIYLIIIYIRKLQLDINMKTSSIKPIVFVNIDKLIENTYFNLRGKIVNTMKIESQIKKNEVNIRLTYLLMRHYIFY